MSKRDYEEIQPLLASGEGRAARSHRAGDKRTMSEGNINKSTDLLTVEPVFEEEPQKSKGITSERIFVVASILVTELCERLTYYSVVANMVLFCTSTLGLTSDEASNVTWVFSGTVYIIPVAGGYVADAFAGKYNTILGSGLIYLLGLFLLPASAVDYTSWFGTGEDLSLEARKAYFFLGLCFVAIGTGGIKANVGPFGAQQVDDLGADAVQSFFNWFYWFINAGAVVAYSGVAYIQQNIGFDWGFMVPLVSMIIALCFFVAAKNKYNNVPPGESIISQSFSVCVQSCNKCSEPSFNRARKQHGGSYDNNMVDGVISVLRVLPIFGFIIVYWAVYSQMSTSLLLQSERMNIKVGGEELPAAMLNIFNTIAILILIPIMDKLVYPCLNKMGRNPTHLQRMGIGMILAACAMVYAAAVEIVRKDNIEEHGYIQQTLAKDDFNASQLTMFVQVPEFAFIGASEVFASISGLEFAYTQAPVFMQGLIMGLFLMTSGLGSYLSTAIVAIVKAASNDDWFPSEPNYGHMEYLLFLMAGLTIVNLLFFIVVAKMYKYRTPDFERTDTDNLDVHQYNNYDSTTEKKEKPPHDSTNL